MIKLKSRPFYGYFRQKFESLNSGSFMPDYVEEEDRRRNI